MLESVTISALFSLLLIFCRIGSCIMVLPGFKELYVPVRSRLLFSLAISFLLMPTLRSSLPAFPHSALVLAMLMLGEIIVGIFIGSVTTILVTAMDTLGLIVATQSGLGSALLFDPNQGTQGAIVGNFVGMMIVTLFFITDMHYVLLRGLQESYQIFLPGHIPDTGDMSSVITRIVGQTFEVSLKLAAPQIVIGLLIFLGGGILSRLMPAMQIFFLLMPIQILISFFIITITLSTGMLWYLGFFEDTLTDFFTFK